LTLIIANRVIDGEILEIKGDDLSRSRGRAQNERRNCCEYDSVR